MRVAAKLLAGAIGVCLLGLGLFRVITGPTIGYRIMGGLSCAAAITLGIVATRRSRRVPAVVPTGGPPLVREIALLAGLVGVLGAGAVSAAFGLPAFQIAAALFVIYMATSVLVIAHKDRVGITNVIRGLWGSVR